MTRNRIKIAAPRASLCSPGPMDIEELDRWSTRLTEGAYEERDSAWRALQREDPERFATALCARLDTNRDLTWMGLAAIVGCWEGPLSRHRDRAPWRFATPLMLALKRKCRDPLMRLPMSDWFGKVMFVNLSPIFATSPDDDYLAAKRVLEHLRDNELSYDAADSAHDRLRFFFGFDPQKD